MELSNSDSESIAEICNNSDEDDKKTENERYATESKGSAGFKKSRAGIFCACISLFCCSTCVSMNTERPQEKNGSVRTEKHIGVFLKQIGSIEALAFKPRQLTATELF